jgi:Leucine-rich repeat (LRR) protein
MDGVESLEKLEKLELYDNCIEEISHLDRLGNLLILDISFNAIREMAPVALCPQLRELYIAQNKLRKIEGLEGLSDLRILDLGANRIRVNQASRRHLMLIMMAMEI